MTRRFALLVLSSILVAPSLASAQTWPTDDQWRLLYCGEGLPAFDPVMDEPGATNERDVVGDSTQEAIYFFADATFLYFRMRVEDSPASGSDFRPFGWGVALDSDSVRTTYEVLAMVDGNLDVVRLDRNTDQRLLDDPADPPESNITSYPTTTHARAVPAENTFLSSFGGDGDFFVDWALPLADLAAAGVVASTEIVLVMGTSSNAVSINADLVCHDGSRGEPRLSEVSTNALRPDGQPVADADGDGLTDAEETRIGTSTSNPDTDGDGFTDAEEVRAGSDPLDPDSTPDSVAAGGGIRGGPGAWCAAGGGSRGAPTSLLLLLGLALIVRRRWRS